MLIGNQNMKSLTKLSLPEECKAEVAHTNHDLRAKDLRGSALHKLSGQRWQSWEQQAWKIWTSFLKPHLPESQGLNLVDIGSGFGLYNIHVARHYKMSAHITYFDGEGGECYAGAKCDINTPLDGWHPEISKMPFYRNNLTCAKQIAVANGVPEANVHITAATKDHLKSMSGKVDVIYSHVSYGFHYPASHYRTEAYDALKPGGLLLLTLRHGQGIKLPSPDGRTRDVAAVDASIAVRDLEQVGFKCRIRDSETYDCSHKCKVYRCVK